MENDFLFLKKVRLSDVAFEYYVARSQKIDDHITN